MKHLMLTNRYKAPAKQHGAALIIGLVLLISLTIVGIGVLGTSSLEQRMAANMTDVHLAFHSADTAGRAFTARVRNGNFRNLGEVCQGIGMGCKHGNSAEYSANWWDTADQDWWENNSFALDARFINQPIEGVDTQPRLVVEQQRRARYSASMGYDYMKPALTYISVISRGTGASSDTEVIIQQVISKK